MGELETPSEIRLEGTGSICLHPHSCLKLFWDNLDNKQTVLNSYVLMKRNSTVTLDGRPFWNELGEACQLNTPDLSFCVSVLSVHGPT